MKYTSEKLAELQKELNVILNQVQAGKLTKREAGDKIIHLKEQIDLIINHLNRNRKLK
jgi:hypothetical protein